MTEDGIGVPLRRREDRRFLTGRGRYVHDIERPQQLHVVHADVLESGSSRLVAHD